MAIRFTPTPTPSNTPTISLTPSITPTITPSSTSCPYVCCFPDGFNTFVNGLVASQYLLDDGSFLVRPNALTWEGSAVVLGRFSPCGELLNNYTLPSGVVGGFGTFGKLSDGRIIVSVGNTLLRLNSNYTLDNTFVSGRTSLNASIIGLGINSQDEILITGVFTGYTTSAGTISYNQNVYKLNKDGIPDPTWSGKSISYGSINFFDGNVFNDYNNKIMLRGNIATYGDSSYQGIVRLNDDFSLDTTFRAVGFSGTNGNQVFTAEPLSNGKYLVGGAFQNYSGQSAQDFLIRLNSDGSLDTTFDFNNIYTNQFVYDLKVQSTGKIVVADALGDLRRYNSNGSFDTTFFSGTSSSLSVYNELSLLLFPTDDIMVGGAFQTYNGQPYPKLVKLEPNGELNMCPFPSATPTNTPTQTTTPSNTPTLTPDLSPSATPTNTPTPSFVSYLYAGGASQWGSSALACSNKTCARPYWKSVPSWAIGTVVYDNSSLTTPTNGNNLWIAVDTSTGTFCSGLAWAAVQVDTNGVILDFISCP